MRNVRLAFRTLARTPFVSLVAILSLALGIGANSAIFSLFDQILLRPLPVPAPHELVNLGAPGPKPGSHVVQPGGQLRPDLQLSDVPRPRARAEQLHRPRRASDLQRQRRLQRPDRVRRAACWCRAATSRCSASTPAAGPALHARRRQDAWGTSYLVVLSHDYWRRRFQEEPGRGRPDADRQRARRDDRSASRRAGFEGTTLGVEPCGVRADHHARPDAAGTVAAPASRIGARYWAYLFARLKPGVTIDAGARRAERRPIAPSSTTSRRRCSRG